MRSRKTIAVVLVGFFCILFFSFYKPSNKYFYIAKSLNIFSALFKDLTIYYVDSVDVKMLIEEGIAGMLESLDPYSVYIAPDRVTEFDKENTGKYAGIGVLATKIDNKVLILDVYEAFPAKRAGIRVGDEILSIDGLTVKGKSLEAISKRFQGKVSSVVTLLIKRQGRKGSINIDVVREEIKLKNIAYRGMLGDKIGYIKLQDFRTGAALEVEKAIETLKSRGMNKLVLDLRDNPGGLLYEAINVANVFLPQGLEVVSVRGRVDDWNRSYSALNYPMDTTIPLVILINEGSASASEIVSGALQDYDRAILLGGKYTFGKALVQTTRALPYDAQLKITAAKYYIPSGRCIQVIDYTHKKNSDSTHVGLSKQVYYTRSGRSVYEGQGIASDVKVDEDHLAVITESLLASGQLFQYASFFCGTHVAPSSSEALEAYKIDYDDFIARLNWSTLNRLLSSQLEKVVEVAKKDNVYHDIRDDIVMLRQAITQSETVSITTFNNEIDRKLKEEIAFHYGLVNNRVEMTLSLDKQVLAAKRILKDSLTYRQLLTPM